MKKFLLPLGVFIVGMVLLLIASIFYPAIATTVTTTKSQIGSQTTALFWGLDWALDSTRLIIFVIGLGCVLLSVFTVWLKRR